MRHLTFSLALLTILALLAPVHGSISSISSSSPLVGVLASYSIIITNQTNLTRLDFSFTNWTNTNNDPFSSTTIL
jgi:hypothetical protein